MNAHVSAKLFIISFRVLISLKKKVKYGRHQRIYIYLASKLNFARENGFHVRVKNRICQVNMAYSLAQETEYTDVIILSRCRRDGKRNLMACGGITWRVIDRQWARSIARRICLPLFSFSLLLLLLPCFPFISAIFVIFLGQFLRRLRKNWEQQRPFIFRNVSSHAFSIRYSDDILDNSFFIECQGDHREPAFDFSIALRWLSSIDCGWRLSITIDVGLVLIKL